MCRFILNLRQIYDDPVRVYTSSNSMVLGEGSIMTFAPNVHVDVLEPLGGTVASLEDDELLQDSLMCAEG